MSILRVQFPEDFDERYDAYKAKIFGDSNKIHINKKNDTNTIQERKYSDAREPIRIQTLGIEVSGNYISKGNEKPISINDTDKWLIYFLYYKFIDNADECFESDRLATEMESEMGKKSEKYVKNRIVVINKKVRELITKNKTNIRGFIKHERGRGYHLHPRMKITK